MFNLLFKMFCKYLQPVFWLGFVSLAGISSPVLANAVNYIETQVNGQNSVAGLGGISDVAVSMDGRFVYTASYVNSAVSVFERDLVTGQLTYRSTTTGATTAFSVDISSDDKHIYVASPTAAVIYAYSRDATTGVLTKVGETGNATGSRGFVSVSVSPDGKHVYGIGAQSSANGLVVFGRNPDTGVLTVLHDYKDNENDHALGQAYGPTTSPIKNIVTSADGAFVYVTSTSDDAVTLFSRNAETGALTQKAVYKDGVNGVDGLDSAASAKRSPDGKHLYVTGQNENSVVIFSIDTISGELTYLDKVANGIGGIDKMAGPRSLTVSPDGRYVIVGSITNHSLTIFQRNAGTGLLTLDSVVENGTGVVSGLSAPSGMSTDPLNRNLYVAGQSANSLVVFSLPTPAVSLSTTTATAQVSGSAVTLDNMLEIFDSDSINLMSAAVSIENGFISTDVLAIQTIAGISASYDSATGVLALSGTASLADYQTVLRTLTYQAGADPSLAPGGNSSRTIGLQVTDEDGNTSATVMINVTVEKSDMVAVTLSFNSQGGSAVENIETIAGASVTLPAAPEYIGYSFSGWNTAADGSGTMYNAGSSFVMSEVDITLYAQWVINQYTLTFDSAGGSAVAPITASFGSAITAPAAPIQEGYTFNGWSPAVPATMPAANTTLIAQWVINQYTLTFDSAGGSAVAPITANFGSVITAPAAPTREGYTFAGWNPVIPTTMPAANSTLTAQWTVNSYILTFDSAGGSAVAPITANFGSVITAPAAPTREGYTFAGWSPVVPATMPAANSTLTAQWTVNSYTLTFDSAGGSAVAPMTASFGSVITAPAAPMREGYTFAGWSPVVPATMPAANSTLTAQWTVNSYTLTFDSAGGSAVAPITANFGSVITVPATPEREGYIFTGWSPAVPATMPAQDMTFTALYTQTMVTVTATVTGEASVSPASQQVPYGTAATVSLTLNHADDIIRLSSSDSCAAALSGSSVVTAALRADCAIAVSVYPNTRVERDSTEPLVSNAVTQFRFVNGAGDKRLVQASLLRSGVDSVLEQTEAETLLTIQADGSYLFSASRTGRYTLEFIDQVSSELVQVTFDVLPYLAFTSSRQPVQQDVTSSLQVWLSDEPIEYPVTASVITDGASMITQQIELTAQHQLLRTYDITATGTTARVTLQSSSISNAHAGTPAVHDLIVQQALPALVLKVAASQNDVATYVITQTAGPVTLSASGFNAVAVEYSWVSSGDLELQVADNLASFDPLNLAEGRYSITVTAEAADGRKGQYELALRVVAVCPFENCAGVSGIPASENAFAATPNRLPLCPDVAQNNRVASCQSEGSQELYAEVPNQYQLTLGTLTEEQSWNAGQFGIALNDHTLVDSGADQLGPVINFDIIGLETPGEAVSIAVPLPVGAVIPANAVWRKYINGQWQNFVVDAANKTDSAARNTLGLCPGVSSDVWSSGLSEGHSCIRLTIEDGGPNDEDGLANGVIRDPGVLAVLHVAPEPEPTQQAKVTSGGTVGSVMATLLATLVLWRRKTTVVALLLPLGVSANSFYSGADVLAVNNDTSNGKVTTALSQSGLGGAASISDKNRTGFRVYGGYAITDWLSAEIAWLDAGKIHTTFSDLAADTTVGQLSSIRPASGEGFEASVLLQPWTLAEHFKPGLRIGLWRMKHTDNYQLGSQSVRYSDTDTVAVVELSGEYQLTSDWSVKAGISHYDVDNGAIRSVQLGLKFRF